MMQNFNNKHPELAAKVTNLIESGLCPDEIINHFRSEDEKKIHQPTTTESEIFPDEIYQISQAFAYRSASKSDEVSIFNLLHRSYSIEIDGDESFRSGEAVSIDTIRNLIDDESYQWILAELPSGRHVGNDDSLIGVCCFSTTGLSRRNGIVEGKLGSIRFFGILPRYKGFCVGQRILSKVEDVIFNKPPFCCRSMVCIPSARTSLLKWVERRGYSMVGSMPYPASALGHTLKGSGDSSQVELIQFIKSGPSLLSADSAADDKLPTVKSLTSSSSNSNSTTESTSRRRTPLQSSAVMVSQTSSFNPTELSAIMSGSNGGGSQPSESATSSTSSFSTDKSDKKSRRLASTAEEDMITVD